jgi:protein-S-isoprenylcysteine O-methyltransferase Ste14
VPAINERIIGLLWLAWLVYWSLSAIAIKAAERRESPRSRASHVVPLVVGVLMIVAPQTPWGVLSWRPVPYDSGMAWVGTLLLALGLAFSVWARLHLGRNWSGDVTMKYDHELIKTGPYRFIRHPIYTGLLLALVGCAIARDELRGLVGLLIAAAALVRKLRLEERWLSERFGNDYARYREKVAALIPLIR